MSLNRYYQRICCCVFGAVLAIYSTGMLSFFTNTAAADSPAAVKAQPSSHIITIYDGGREQSIITKASTVQKALEEFGARLDKQHDIIEPGLNIKIRIKNQCFKLSLLRFISRSEPSGKNTKNLKPSQRPISRNRANLRFCWRIRPPMPMWNGPVNWDGSSPGCRKKPRSSCRNWLIWRRNCRNWKGKRRIEGEAQISPLIYLRVGSIVIPYFDFFLENICMAIFIYKAKARNGRTVKGDLDAPSLEFAENILRRKGYSLVWVKPRPKDLLEGKIGRAHV